MSSPERDSATAAAALAFLGGNAATSPRNGDFPSERVTGFGRLLAGHDGIAADAPLVFGQAGKLAAQIFQHLLHASEAFFVVVAGNRSHRSLV
jgi:hypothetical protein